MWLLIWTEQETARGNRKKIRKRRESSLKTELQSKEQGGNQEGFIIKAMTHWIRNVHVKQHKVKVMRVKKDDKNELQKLSELFKHVLAAQKISKGINLKLMVCTFFNKGSREEGFA